MAKIEEFNDDEDNNNLTFAKSQVNRPEKAPMARNPVGEIFRAPNSNTFHETAKPEVIKAAPKRDIFDDLSDHYKAEEGRKTTKTKTVPIMLREAAALFEERNATYGSNYKTFGVAMQALFPNGLKIATTEDWNRLGVLVQIVSKMTRYTNNFQDGGHDDSLADMAVYSNMLRELDTEINLHKAPF